MQNAVLEPSPDEKEPESGDWPVKAPGFELGLGAQVGFNWPMKGVAKDSK